MYYSSAEGDTKVRDLECKGLQLNYSEQSPTEQRAPQRYPLDPSHVLPLELFFQILGYLEATSLAKAAAVSW